MQWLQPAGGDDCIETALRDHGLSSWNTHRMKRTGAAAGGGRWAGGATKEKEKKKKKKKVVLVDNFLSKERSLLIIVYAFCVWSRVGNVSDAHEQTDLRDLLTEGWGRFSVCLVL